MLLGIPMFSMGGCDHTLQSSWPICPGWAELENAFAVLQAERKALKKEAGGTGCYQLPTQVMSRLVTTYHNQFFPNVMFMFGMPGLPRILATNMNQLRENRLEDLRINPWACPGCFDLRIPVDSTCLFPHRGIVVTRHCVCVRTRMFDAPMPGKRSQAAMCWWEH